MTLFEENEEIKSLEAKVFYKNLLLSKIDLNKYKISKYLEKMPVFPWPRFFLYYRIANKNKAGDPDPKMCFGDYFWWQ